MLSAFLVGLLVVPFSWASSSDCTVNVAVSPSTWTQVGDTYSFNMYLTTGDTPISVMDSSWPSSCVPICHAPYDVAPIFGVSNVSAHCYCNGTVSGMEAYFQKNLTFSVTLYCGVTSTASAHDEAVLFFQPGDNVGENCYEDFCSQPGLQLSGEACNASGYCNDHNPCTEDRCDAAGDGCGCIFQWDFAIPGCESQPNATGGGGSSWFPSTSQIVENFTKYPRCNVSCPTDYTVNVPCDFYNPTLETQMCEFPSECQLCLLANGIPFGPTCNTVTAQNETVSTSESSTPSPSPTPAVEYSTPLPTLPTPSPSVELPPTPTPAPTPTPIPIQFPTLSDLPTQSTTPSPSQDVPIPTLSPTPTPSPYSTHLPSPTPSPTPLPSPSPTTTTPSPTPAIVSTIATTTPCQNASYCTLDTEWWLNHTYWFNLILNDSACEIDPFAVFNTPSSSSDTWVVAAVVYYTTRANVYSALTANGCESYLNQTQRQCFNILETIISNNCGTNGQNSVPTIPANLVNLTLQCAAMLSEFNAGNAQVPTCENPDLSACLNSSRDDGVATECDNCPELPNPLQEDCDGNGVGDACDHPFCGNGCLEDGEECDDGLHNCFSGGCTEEFRCTNECNLYVNFEVAEGGFSNTTTNSTTNSTTTTTTTDDDTTDGELPSEGVVSAVVIGIVLGTIGLAVLVAIVSACRPRPNIFTASEVGRQKYR